MIYTGVEPATVGKRSNIVQERVYRIEEDYRGEGNQSIYSIDGK